jgi:ribose transport system substrate-binding protein
MDQGKFARVVADTLKVQLELLRDGYADVLVGQRPYEMGERAMDILLKLKKGEKVDEIVYAGIDRVTKENVGAMLK